MNDGIRCHGCGARHEQWEFYKSMTVPDVNVDRNIHWLECQRCCAMKEFRPPFINPDSISANAPTDGLQFYDSDAPPCERCFSHSTAWAGDLGDEFDVMCEACGWVWLTREETERQAEQRQAVKVVGDE